MTAAHLPPWQTEYRFKPDRRWRLDFAWPEPRFGWQGIACEVEGGVWVRGRHTRPVGFSKDVEKYNELALAGWLLLRVTSDMVNDGRAIAYLERAFARA